MRPTVSRRRPALVVADQSSHEARPRPGTRLMTHVSAGRAMRRKPAPVTAAAHPDWWARPTESVRVMRAHRDMALDSLAEQEARWRLQQPQAAPDDAPGQVLLGGLLVAVVVWLGYFVPLAAARGGALP